MTLPIARDLSRQGVRICTIAPGIFNTPMMAGAPDQVRDPLIEMVQYPKRLGLPPEFASLSKQIVENPYLNGETILEKHSLVRSKEVMNFTVKDNSTNVLILFADDLGKAPPATVALLITDGINSKTLTLRSDLEQSEAITLKYYPQE